MSRIGKAPVEIPAGVTVSIEGGAVKVKGPKGSLELTLRPEVDVELKDRVLTVTKKTDGRMARALHGLTRTLIANMVTGVTTGFEKRLELVGVGYRAEAKGDTMVLNLGYSNPVTYKLPKGVSAKVEKNVIVLSSADKQLLGQVAAEIRGFRPPEPYKGKGVKYAGEVIRRKAGKAGKGAGG